MNWPDLRGRDTALTEWMDDPQVDPDALRRTYARFAPMNDLLAGWRAIYCRELRPWLRPERPNTLLDIGCGGGDVARRLAHWAARDGLTLRVTGIDTDARAIRYALAQPARSGVTFRCAGSHDLVRAGESFDLVVSNHLLHHLPDAGVQALLQDSARLASGRSLHNDIERHPLAYLGFRLLIAPLFPGTLIPADGLLSVRRSFTASELRALLPPGWTVRRQFPFRLWAAAPARDADA